MGLSPSVFAFLNDCNKGYKHSPSGVENLEDYNFHQVLEMSTATPRSKLTEKQGLGRTGTHTCALIESRRNWGCTVRLHAQWGYFWCKSFRPTVLYSDVKETFQMTASCLSTFKVKPYFCSKIFETGRKQYLTLARRGWKSASAEAQVPFIPQVNLYVNFAWGHKNAHTLWHISINHTHTQAHSKINWLNTNWWETVHQLSVNL